MKVNLLTLGRLSVFCALTLSVMCAFAACNAGVSIDGAATSIDRISFTVDDFSVLDDDPQTRTSIQNGSEFIWAAGDTVGIYPNTGAQIVLAGKNRANFNLIFINRLNGAFCPSRRGLPLRSFS